MNNRKLALTPVGKYLEKMREDRQEPQWKFASRIGIGQGTYSGLIHYQDGMTLSVAQKLYAFGVPAKLILTVA